MAARFDDIFDVTPMAFRYSRADAFTPPNAHYGPTGSDIVSATTTPTIDHLYAFPFYAGFGGTIDSLNFLVQVAGGAGSKGRVGIYDSDTSGLGLVPRNLLVDGGEYDTTAATLKSTPVALTLREGEMYWFAAVYGTAAPQVTGFTSGWHMFGRSATFAAQLGWEKVGFTYAALPAVFPVGPPQPGICTGGATLVTVTFSQYNRMRRFGP